MVENNLSNVFDIEYDRKKSGSIKWNIINNIKVAASIADMDFAVSQDIINDLKLRLKNPFLGYEFSDDNSKGAIVDWYFKLHGVKIEKANIIECPFNLRATLQLLERSLLTKDDVILVVTPTYKGLLRLGIKIGCKLIEWPMKKFNLKYDLDLDKLNSILLDNKPTVLVFCNPNNPTGQIINLEKIETAVNLIVKKSNLKFIISDEVHGDLIYPSNESQTILKSSIMEKYAIVLSSVGKTFNLSGLNTSFIISRNPLLLKKIETRLDRDGFYQGSLIGNVIQTSAMKNGLIWRNALVSYLEDLSIDVIKAFSENDIDVEVLPPQASFLIIVNYSRLKIDENKLRSVFLERGISVQYSNRFSNSDSEKFFRFNFAAPRHVVMKWVNIICETIRDLIKNE